MLKPVGFSGKGKAICVLEDPVKERRGKDRVTHHLSPVSDLLVRSEDE